MALFDPIPEEEMLRWRLRTALIDGRNALMAQYANLYRVVWANPDFEPQKIIDMMGEDGGAFIDWLKKVGELLIAGGCPVDSEPPKEYTTEVNADGTVLVIKK